MVKKSAMKKKYKKPWKINSLILRAFIIIAVVIMLISVMLDEGRKVSKTTITHEEIGK